MKALVIDIETTSACDLTTRGVFNYAHDPSTAVLCCAYADADNESEPKIWRIDKDGAIDNFCEFLCSFDLLIAHNAQFERTVLGTICPKLKEAELWADSAMLSGVAARPHSLRDACRGLCFPDSLEKDARGKRLLNMFSIQSSKLYIGHYSNDPEAFEELCEYCRQDVRAERAVWNALRKYYTVDVMAQWLLDCGVEDNGIPIDMDEIEGASALFKHFQEEAEKAATELTGGVSLRSTVGLRRWTEQNGYPLSSFSRASVDEALANELACTGAPQVAELLKLRKAVAGTAGKKFDAFIGYCCEDGRVRGSLESRVATTGRYAGRGIQPQNLPRGFVDPLMVGHTREAAKMAKSNMDGAVAYMRLIAYAQEVDALASLCRDSIAAPSGEVFVVADYSAVEARVLAWLSGEDWVNEIFHGDGKIYERTAAAMYKKNVESITKSERMAGKIATLALGYGGGVCALQRFASAYGVNFDDDQAKAIVDSWRLSRPKTTALWKTIDSAFRCVATGQRNEVRFTAGGQTCFVMSDEVAGRPVIKIKIPSGRVLTYWDAQVDPENGEICVETYKTGGAPLPAKAKGASMSRVYGGFLTENLTQAVAFDLLLSSLLAIDARRDLCRIVMHIHDEVVVECKEDNALRVSDFIRSSMEHRPKWAAGLALKAEPEIMKRYKK